MQLFFVLTALIITKNTKSFCRLLFFYICKNADFIIQYFLFIQHFFLYQNLTLENVPAAMHCTTQHATNIKTQSKALSVFFNPLQKKWSTVHDEKCPIYPYLLKLDRFGLQLSYRRHPNTDPGRLQVGRQECHKTAQK